jgi:hypothetical protein
VPTLVVTAREDIEIARQARDVLLRASQEYPDVRLRAAGPTAEHPKNGSFLSTGHAMMSW